jgi:hypothetical protein
MKSWITQKIPALRGKRPKQATKTSEGRELLESLLLDFEKSAKKGNDIDFQLKLIQEVKDELGLNL